MSCGPASFPSTATPITSSCQGVSSGAQGTHGKCRALTSCVRRGLVWWRQAVAGGGGGAGCRCAGGLVTPPPLTPLLLLAGVMATCSTMGGPQGSCQQEAVVTRCSRASRVGVRQQWPTACLPTLGARTLQVGG
jgi:hypothetical protein